MEKRIDIVFDRPLRSEWIRQIIEYRRRIEFGCKELHVLLKSQIHLCDFEPMHFVTLSCLIDVAKVSNAQVWLEIENDELKRFVFNDVRLTSYWTERQIPYYREPEQKAYNL